MRDFATPTQSSAAGARSAARDRAAISALRTICRVVLGVALLLTFGALILYVLGATPSTPFTPGPSPVQIVFALLIASVPGLLGLLVYAFGMVAALAADAVLDIRDSGREGYQG